MASRLDGVGAEEASLHELLVVGEDLVPGRHRRTTLLGPPITAVVDDTSIRLPGLGLPDDGGRALGPRQVQAAAHAVPERSQEQGSGAAPRRRGRRRVRARGRRRCRLHRAAVAGTVLVELSLVGGGLVAGPQEGRRRRGAGAVVHRALAEARLG